MLMRVCVDVGVDDDVSVGVGVDDSVGGGDSSVVRAPDS